MYFGNYRLRRTWLNKCLKSPYSEHPSRSDMVKDSKHCWNLHLYYIHSSLRKQLSWKETLLVIYKDLGLFVNTLTADDKYSLLSRDNLTQKFLMKLPKKEKATSRVSAAFLKSRLYFEYFPKKKKIWPS